MRTSFRCAWLFALGCCVTAALGQESDQSAGAKDPTQAGALEDLARKTNAVLGAIGCSDVELQVDQETRSVEVAQLTEEDDAEESMAAGDDEGDEGKQKPDKGQKKRGRGHKTGQTVLKGIGITIAVAAGLVLGFIAAVGLWGF